MLSYSRLWFSLIGCLFLTSDAISSSQADNWVVNCQKNQCEAVIDAGSSGSRLHVYQRNTSSNQVIEVFQQKISPGLSSVELNQLDDYLAKLLPAYSNLSIDTYFYATAGMRLLPDNVQNDYYQKIQAWMTQQNTWQLKDIRTITGQEEGAYAWIAVNHDRDLNNLEAVIEFGGASAQVNIPIPDDKKELFTDKNVMHLKMNGHEYSLWSKSYLGLGINEVEKLFGEQESCYSVGYPLKNGQLAYGDTTQCIEGIENNNALLLISQLDEAKQVLTALNQPMAWMALGSLYYTAVTPPFQFSQQALSLTELKSQADSVSCHQDWLSLLSEYKDDPFLYRNCFAASYFYAYMADGMGLDVNDVIQLPQENQATDWAFGVALTHQNV